MLPRKLISSGAHPPNSSRVATFMRMWGWRAYASPTLWRAQQASTSVEIAPGVRPDGTLRPNGANDRRPKIAYVLPRVDYGAIYLGQRRGSADSAVSTRGESTRLGALPCAVDAARRAVSQGSEEGGHGRRGRAL